MTDQAKLTPLFSIPETSAGIVLAALRYFQDAIDRGDDIEYLSDIADVSKLSATDIDVLCEKINLGDSATVMSFLEFNVNHLTEEDKASLREAAENGEEYVTTGADSFVIRIDLTTLSRNLRHGVGESLPKILEDAFNARVSAVQFSPSGQIDPAFPIYR